MHLELPVDCIIALMGSYGSEHISKGTSKRSRAKQFMSELYGDRIRRLDTYMPNEDDSPIIEYEFKDDSLALSACSRILFNNSPCFAITDVERALEAVKDLPKESYRFLSCYKMTILCVENPNEAMKVKLSI